MVPLPTRSSAHAPLLPALQHLPSLVGPAPLRFPAVPHHLPLALPLPPPRQVAPLELQQQVHQPAAGCQQRQRLRRLHAATHPAAPPPPHAGWQG